MNLIGGWRVVIDWGCKYLGEAKGKWDETRQPIKRVANIGTFTVILLLINLITSLQGGFARIIVEDVGVRYI